MNENTESLEVLQPSALESLERAQIDVQVATAHRFPRSLEQFKRRALDMVQQDLQTAESCIYYRPVGKGDDGQQKYAEGASIRMAEIVASCFGNIRFGARIIEQTERFVKAEGVCHDLESNTAGKSEAMESTVKRNGQPYDERMRIVVAKACLSKALRDAIFRVVPRALCKSIYDAAAATIAKQSKTIEQRRELAKKWLTSLKVTEDRAFAVLNVKGWSEVGNEQLLVLTGIHTAMKDNEVTIDEAFPPLATTAKPTGQTPPTPPTPPAPVKPAEKATSAPVPEPTKPASEPQEQNAAPSTPEPAETQPTATQQAATPAPEAVQTTPEPSEPANTAEQQAPATQQPPADPVAAVRNAIESLGVSEKQLMRYLQGLKPPMARGTQNSLDQLADSKLNTLLGQLENEKIVDAIKATAV